MANTDILVNGKVGCIISSNKKKIISRGVTIFCIPSIIALHEQRVFLSCLCTGWLRNLSHLYSCVVNNLSIVSIEGDVAPLTGVWIETYWKTRIKKKSILPI